MPSSLRFFSICFERARAARSSADIAQPMAPQICVRVVIVTDSTRGGRPVAASWDVGERGLFDEGRFDRGKKKFFWFETNKIDNRDDSLGMKDKVKRAPRKNLKEKNLEDFVDFE